jgi:hypothetical protein
MCCGGSGEKHRNPVSGLAVMMGAQVGEQKRRLGKEGMVKGREILRNSGPGGKGV